MPSIRPQSLACMLIAGVAGSAAAQQATPFLSCDGFQSVSFVDTRVAQDFIIPNLTGARIELRVSGANGGDAVSGPLNDCVNRGGDGATASMTAFIGTGTNELNPGGTLRFIVGERGEADSNPQNGRAGGGGGGGTGVLYLPVGRNPGVAEDWVILSAAGGGGGAASGFFLGICTSPNRGNGLNGNTSECGSFIEFDTVDPPNAGCNGSSGTSVFVTVSGSPALIAGGGGGIEQGDGLGQGNAGLPSGGAGGDIGQRGGWGFGGGGAGKEAGGGGGGYSGGASGAIKVPSQAVSGGGGGGSLINTAFAIPGSTQIIAQSPASGNGYAGYSIVQAAGRATNNFPEQAAPIAESFAGRRVSLTCGVTASNEPYLNTPVTEPDLWFRYTNPDERTRAVSVTPDVPIPLFAYSDSGVFDPAAVRGRSSGSAILTVDVAAGESILLRAASAFVTDVTLTLASVLEPPPTCQVSNDMPDQATTLEEGVSYAYDLTCATLSMAGSCDDFAVDADRWYSFTAPSNGQFFASLDFEGNFLQQLRSVSIFDPQTMTELACDRDTQGSIRYADAYDSAIPYPLVQGQRILVRVASRKLDPLGTLRFEFDPNVVNDRCATTVATPVSVGTDLMIPINMSRVELDPLSPSICFQQRFNDEIDSYFAFTGPDQALLIVETNGFFNLSSSRFGCDGLVDVCVPSSFNTSSIGVNTFLADVPIVWRISSAQFNDRGTIRVIVPRINPAEWSAPTDQTDIFDLIEYLKANDADDPIADLNEPFRVIDSLDVVEFVSRAVGSVVAGP